MLAGCATDPTPRATRPLEPGAGEAGASTPWWPSPAAVRVFPSTRFVREGSQTFLEARVELLDSLGDPVKWPGAARFELLAARTTRPLQTGGTLYAWRIDVVTRDEQLTHYDPVTRTYLFRLIVDDPAVAARPTAVRVEFSPLEGPRLTDLAAIDPPGRAD